MKQKGQLLEYQINIAQVCQGPLITDGLNSCKWTRPLVVLAKTFIMVKIFEKYFLMDSFIDRMGYRSHLLHLVVATP